MLFAVGALCFVLTCFVLAVGITIFRNEKNKKKSRQLMEWQNGKRKDLEQSIIKSQKEGS